MTRPYRRPTAWLATAFLAGAAAPVVAGGEAAPSPSPYQLAVPAKAFRLAESPAYRLQGTPPASSGTKPELADKPFAREIAAAAREASLDPALVHAIIHVESRHRQAAVSPKGAVGLMQVLPNTAARYGIPNPGRSPQANLAAGTRYLRDLMQQFDNRLDLALAAYNAGERAVLRHANRIPPYRETQAYVPAVMTQYEEWRAVPRVPARIEYLPGTRLELISSDR